MADLDSLVDMVSDDADMSDLTTPGVDVSIVPDSEPEPQEDYREAAPQPDVDEELELDPPEPEQGAPAEESLELEERDWYGQTFKVDKRLGNTLDKFFTEKNQRLNQEHKERVAALEAKERAIAEQDRANREYREKLQAHLDANPQFAESWNEVAERQRQSQDFAQLQSQFNQLQETLQQERARQQIESELNRLAEQYPIPEESPLSLDQVRKMALAEVIASGYQVDLDYAWQNVASQLNGRVRSKAAQRLANAVKSQSSVPKTSPASQKRSGGKRTSSKPRSIDELLSKHMSMPDEYFER